MKNIIRETDSHNAALKSKETREAKRRLKGLQIVPSSADASLDHSSSRYGQNERTDKHHRKRRRVESEGDDDRINGTRSKRSSYRRENETREERDERRKSSYRRDHQSDSDSDLDKVSRRHRKSHSRRTYRSRSRSPHRSSRRDRSDRHRRYRYSDSSLSDRDRGHHRSRRKTNRSDSRSPDRIKRSKDKSNIAKKAASPIPEYTEADEVDSDPLKAIVGPAPPPPAPKIRARGRGTFASSSAMDTHFSSTYDPSVDIHPNSDSGNDWDQALEALRDRQRWKKQGAERLRSAGFTEEEVTKWEKGGEKTEEDVKWRGMGEGREWDRGKVVDESGMIDRKPEWGRLKGT